VSLGSNPFSGARNGRRCLTLTFDNMTLKINNSHPQGEYLWQVLLKSHIPQLNKENGDPYAE